MPFLDFLAAFSARPAGGSGFIFRDNITVNTQNYNLRTRALASGWNGTSPLLATVVVQPGVVVSSSTPTTPSIDTGSMPAGSQISLINGGSIYGAGGNAGAGAGNAGVNGGHAINTTALLSLANFGTIGGGGGGGGGGANYIAAAASIIGGAGGGGGAGNVSGNAGAGATGSLLNGLSGNPGTLNTGGTGGPSGQTLAPLVSLQSGTEFTTNAVYTSTIGAAAFWFSINLAGTVTSLGQSTTRAWVVGQKLFASADSAGINNRSNFVGEYTSIFASTGAVQSFTSPSTIPAASGFITPSSVFVEMWGQGNPGYTIVNNLPTATTTYTVIIGAAGGGDSGGTIDRSRLLGSPVYVQRSGTFFYGHAMAGVFTANPYDGNFNPTIANTSTIYGIAGGGAWGSGSSAGGGGATGQDGEVCTGGSQSAPGNQGFNDSTNTQIEAGGLIYGGGRQMSNDGCAWAIGGGGLYPGGSAHRNGCSPTAAAGGSGFAGNVGGSISQTIQFNGAGFNTSPYFQAGRVVFRIR